MARCFPRQGTPPRFPSCNRNSPRLQRKIRTRQSYRPPQVRPHHPLRRLLSRQLRLHPPNLRRRQRSSRRPRPLPGTYPTSRPHQSPRHRCHDHDRLRRQRRQNHRRRHQRPRIQRVHRSSRPSPAPHARPEALLPGLQATRRQTSPGRRHSPRLRRPKHHRKIPRPLRRPPRRTSLLRQLLTPAAASISCGTAIPGCALGFFFSGSTLRPLRSDLCALCVEIFSFCLFPITLDFSSTYETISNQSQPMHPIFKWPLIAAAILLLAVCVGLSILAGSPRDAIGMVRYALPHMHRGNLQVGSDAPTPLSCHSTAKRAFTSASAPTANRSSSSSAASLDPRSVARSATSRKSTTTIKTAPISSPSTFAKPTRSTSGR